MYLDVCLTPSEYQPERYGGRIAVVIDVFRATSSMAAAFAHGCAAVIPVETTDAARAVQSRHPGSLLAGERNALKVEGFDLGNSPFEFTAQAVGGKTVIMSTTNGTVALVKAADSLAVYTAAFVNAAAVCRCLRDAGQDVVLVCAGRKGEFSVEDALCAGLLVERLADRAELGDGAIFARGAYQGCRADLLACLRTSSHARYLEEIGFGADVVWCLKHDLIDAVPQFAAGAVRGR